MHACRPCLYFRASAFFSGTYCLHVSGSPDAFQREPCQAGTACQANAMPTRGWLAAALFGTRHRCIHQRGTQPLLSVSACSKQERISAYMLPRRNLLRVRADGAAIPLPRRTLWQAPGPGGDKLERRDTCVIAMQAFAARGMKERGVSRTRQTRCRGKAAPTGVGGSLLAYSWQGAHGILVCAVQSGCAG